MAETTVLFVLEETTTTPDGTITIRRVEVTGNVDQIGGLLAGQSPMLPEPTPEPKPKGRTWDDCLPEILWQEERIRQRQRERARQVQRAVCAPSRGLLQDFYEMVAGG
jgi:hypothetical protein